MNKEACVWLKIVCHYLMLSKYIIGMTSDKVCLSYVLMQVMEINISDIIKSTMMKARVH